MALVSLTPMAIRDKLRENAQPHLEPGEQIQSIFTAQTGPNPYLSILSYLVFFWIRFYAIAATDRRLVVFRASALRPSKIKSLAETFPRETRLGEMKGLWDKFELGGTRYWVHKRFHKDVEAADAALPASPTA